MNNCGSFTRVSNGKSDRISDLPDELLQHILSFLGTRQAVCMSFVSKRWVNLWASLPHINFDWNEFLTMNEFRLSPAVRIQHHAKFKVFVERVLSGREASFLDKFQIQFPPLLDADTYSGFGHACASSAVKLNPRAFIMNDFIHSTDLLAIFTCKSLEELSLTTRFYSQEPLSVIPVAINLPHLRRLQLIRCKLDQRCISSIFSGCPGLEELSLKYCLGEYAYIFNPKLKYLSLYDCELELPYSERTLGITSYLLGDEVELTIRNNPFMFYAQFIWKTQSTSAVDNSSSFKQKLLHRVDLGDNLGGLSGATVLKLYTKYWMVLEEELQRLGEFHHLKELFLSGWCVTCIFGPVKWFLLKCPNLEKLVLRNCGSCCLVMNNGCHQRVDYSMFGTLSRCRKLKVVDIKFCEHHMGAHKMKEVLLAWRGNLKSIEFVLSRDHEPDWCY